ncbi:MAG: hypothetical protein AAF487_02840 [Bacteroidota bacterium]
MVLISCKEQDQTVPNLPVDITLNLNLPIYSDLNTVGNHINVSGGSLGIIVYRLSVDEFKAFDRHCTFNVPDNCRITVDNSGIQAADDECCGSVFSIIDGTVQSGDAFVPLREYQTSFFNNVVTISN